MWALRRAAASPARGQGRSIMLARAFGSDLELSRNTLVHEEGNYDGSSICGSSILPKLYFSRYFYSTKSSIWSRNISSNVGEKSGDKDDDLDNGFSDLGLLPEADDLDNGFSDLGLLPEADDLDNGFSDLGLLPEADSTVGPEEQIEEDDSVASRIGSPLAKIIMGTPPHSLSSALDKWVEEGNPLGRGEFYFAILKLRRRKLYRKALQEWVEANKRFEFVERDYASLLDLVAKVHGPQKAESYLEKIPDNLRGEVIYSTLLASYVAAGNVEKAEDVFKSIQKIGLPITSFACNQLLLLYRRVITLLLYRKIGIR